MPKTVLVCCHKTCPKQGALDVLAEFQKQVPAEVDVVRGGCFGECGSGPLVKVLPDNIWYSQVRTRDVALIVRQHLINNKPVKHKLYQKIHGTQNSPLFSILIFCLFFGFIGLLFWILAGQTNLF